MGKQWKQCQTLFFWCSKLTADGDFSHEIKRHLLLGKKVMTNLDSILKSRDITLSTKVHVVKVMTWMWELDYKESWVPKNWCFWTVVLEKTLASPLDCEEIKQVNPKGNQSWIFIVRTDAEAEAPILWPINVKNRLIGKDPDAGKNWRQEEKGMTEDEMVGWYHRLNGHDFEQAQGAGDGQRRLACCSPWGRKEWDTTEQLNWTCLSVTRVTAAPVLSDPHANLVWGKCCCWGLGCDSSTTTSKFQGRPFSLFTPQLSPGETFN